jgi:hypothetical protein
LRSFSAAAEKMSVLGLFQPDCVKIHRGTRVNVHHFRNRPAQILAFGFVPVQGEYFFGLGVHALDER